MVWNSENQIVNLPTFKREIEPFFSRGNQRVIIETPAKSNIEVTAKDFENLVRTILECSSSLPHKRCALTYKINDNSSISLEIHPVTDAA